MLNLNSLFIKYLNEISLTKNYKNKITTGRDALRKKIGNKFSDNGRSKPKHCSQGSYAMQTAVMPLDEDDFDLDNGVYLQGYTEDQQSWPAATTVHIWVEDAVEGHTDDSPIDKNTCIRVNYLDNYHIDLPIYIMGENEEEEEVAYLAHKSKGWIESDPKAFTQWFQNCVNENGQQIRHIVKYLKAWKDYKGVNIKGMAITILVCENYKLTEDRDDISLLETVTNILDTLEENFQCYKPVIPKDEDLFEDMSESTQNSILDGLRGLQGKLDKAIYNKDNDKEASDILQKVFGDRFPEGKDQVKSNYVRTQSPVKLEEDSHFA